MVNALEQIRDIEREMARRIRAAEEQAEASVAQAGREADLLLEEGQRKGLEAARQAHAEAVAAAREEARSILAEGQTSADELIRSGRPELAGVVDAMVDLVLAPPAEAGV